MPRFSPALCRTPRPGRWSVPLAERVIARTSRFSTQIRSNRRARSVLVVSVQSRRRSASLALSLAMVSLVRSRRRDPLRWRSLRRSSSRSRRCSAGRNPGVLSSSPVDSATATATPRSTPTTCPLPGAGTTGGTAANATCQRPARSRGDPVGPRLWHRAGPAEPDPAELGDQHLAPAAVQPSHILGADGDDPEAVAVAALAPRRWGWRRWPLLRRRVGVALAPLFERREPGGVGGVEVPQRLLLDDHAAGCQPRERGAGFGKLPAVLGEPCHRAAGLPPRPLLHRQVPHVAGVRAVAQQCVLLGGCGVQPVAAHPRNPASTCDNGGKERRFSQPEGRGFDATDAPRWRAAGEVGSRRRLR
jgi:hypothetical protein